MWNILVTAVASILVATSPIKVPNTKVLASHEISLENRQPVPFVNNVFKENILLDIAYARGIVTTGQKVNWDEVNKPFTWSYDLAPGKVFAFTNMVLPKYQADAQPWNQIHYYTSEGFLSDNWLIGDGVCHLASIINWTAQDAGLLVDAPTNHNFAAISDIPKEYGTAIYYDPNSLNVSGLQNLYVKNNKDVSIRFVFVWDGTNLEVKVEESI